MKYINQLNKSDCLFACLKNYLAFLYKDSKYLYIPQDETHSSFSFKEIVEIAKNYGVDLEGFFLTDKTELLNNKEFPIIVCLNTNDGFHSVLLLKINKNYAKYIDPKYGKRYMRTKKFLKLFTSKGLIKTNINKLDFKYQIPSFYNRKSLTIIILFQILGALSIIAGIFLLNHNVPSPYPIVCFSLTAIFEVLYRSFSLSKLKEIDENVLSLWPFSSPVNLFYERLEASKAAYLKVLSSTTFNIILAVFLVTLSIANSLYNVIIVGVAFVVSFFSSFIIHPKLESYKDSLGYIENTLLSCGKKEDAVDSMNKLHNKTYRFAYLSFIEKIVGVLIIFISSLFVMLFNNSYSVVNCIFFLFIGIYLSKSFNSIFLMDENEMNFRVAKAKLMNAIYYLNRNNI